MLIRSGTFANAGCANPVTPTPRGLKPTPSAASLNSAPSGEKPTNQKQKDPLQEKEKRKPPKETNWVNKGNAKINLARNRLTDARTLAKTCEKSGAAGKKQLAC